MHLYHVGRSVLSKMVLIVNKTFEYNPKYGVLKSMVENGGNFLHDPIFKTISKLPNAKPYKLIRF